MWEVLERILRFLFVDIPYWLRGGYWSKTEIDPKKEGDSGDE